MILSESDWAKLEAIPDAARQVDEINTRYFCLCDQPGDARCN